MQRAGGKLAGEDILGGGVAGKTEADGDERMGAPQHLKSGRLDSSGLPSRCPVN